MKTITVESQRDTLEIEFILEWEDVTEAERIRRQRLREQEGRLLHFRLLFIVPALLVLAGGGVAYFAGQLDQLTLVALILLAFAPVVLAVGGWLVRRTEQKKTAEARNKRPGKQRWIVEIGGMTRMQRGETTSIPWTAIQRVRRLGSCVGIFVDEMHYYLIPDRAFVTENQQLRFVRMIKANLDKAGQVTQSISAVQPD